jgi:hypothetical protein
MSHQDRGAAFHDQTQARIRRRPRLRPLWPRPNESPDLRRHRQEERTVLPPTARSTGGRRTRPRAHAKRR